MQETNKDDKSSPVKRPRGARGGRRRRPKKTIAAAQEAPIQASGGDLPAIPADRLADYFGMMLASGSFHIEGEFRRLCEFFGARPGFKIEEESSRFKDVLRFLEEKKLASRSSNGFVVLQPSEKFQGFLKHIHESRGHYLVRINRQNWQDLVSKKVLAFKENLRPLADFKTGDEAVIADNDGCVLGTAYIRDAYHYCNATLIRNSLFPYQVESVNRAWAQPFRIAAMQGDENILKIEPQEFYGLVASGVEKQLESEIFRLRGLSGLYAELEKGYPERLLLHEKVRQLMEDLAGHFHLSLAVRSEQSWDYYELSFYGRSCLRTGFNRDLLPYLENKYYPGRQFRVMVPGKQEEKENLISLERIWYIITASKQLQQEAAKLFA